MPDDTPPLPSLETIAALKPLDDTYGRSVPEVLRELNKAVTDAGIPFEEYGFTALMPHDEATFSDFRWISCAAVTGSNEGYYIHIMLIPSDHNKCAGKLVAVAKVWRPATAYAIAAAASRLLNC